MNQYKTQVQYHEVYSENQSARQRIRQSQIAHFTPTPVQKPTISSLLAIVIVIEQITFGIDTVVSAVKMLFGNTHDA